jgi:hypothetical protein
MGVTRSFILIDFIFTLVNKEKYMINTNLER